MFYFTDFRCDFRSDRDRHRDVGESDHEPHQQVLRGLQQQDLHGRRRRRRKMLSHPHRSATSTNTMTMDAKSAESS